MKKKSIISLCMAIAVSASALTAFASGINENSISISPELKQIQNGTRLVVESEITNMNNEDGNFTYTLTHKDAEGNTIYSGQTAVELDSGESTVCKSTVSIDKIDTDDTFVMTVSGDNQVSEIKEISLDSLAANFSTESNILSALPNDAEMETAWNALSNPDYERSVQLRAATSLTSRNTLQYSNISQSGYSEGLLQNGTMNFESAITNSGTTADTAVYYVASYLASGVLDEMNTVEAKAVGAGETKTVSYSPSMTTAIYNSLSYIKTYTWTKSMIACCDSNKYTKNTHNDNFTMGSTILTKANNYPMLKKKVKLNGSLSTSSDVDTIAFKATASGSVSILKSTTPGGSFKVDVYNSSGSLISNNPSSFSATSGATYYLRISGTVAGNYSITLN